MEWVSLQRLSGPPSGRDSLAIGDARSEDEIRGQEVGPPLLDDLREHPFVGLGSLCRHQGADGETAQGVSDRERSLGRVLAAGERERVGAALAEAVDVHPADLVDQGVDQVRHRVGVLAEDAQLLAVAGLDDVPDGRFQVAERDDGDHRPELLLVVDAHFAGHRVQHCRAEQAHGRVSAAGVDHLRPVRPGVLHQIGQVVDLSRLRATG